MSIATRSTFAYGRVLVGAHERLVEGAAARSSCELAHPRRQRTASTRLRRARASSRSRGARREATRRRRRRLVEHRGPAAALAASSSLRAVAVALERGLLQRVAEREDLLLEPRDRAPGRSTAPRAPCRPPRRRSASAGAARARRACPVSASRARRASRSTQRVPLAGVVVAEVDVAERRLASARPTRSRGLLERTSTRPMPSRVPVCWTFVTADVALLERRLRRVLRAFARRDRAP